MPRWILYYFYFRYIPNNGRPILFLFETYRSTEIPGLVYSTYMFEREHENTIFKISKFLLNISWKELKENTLHIMYINIGIIASLTLFCRS